MLEIPPLKTGEVLNWKGVNPELVVHVFDARFRTRKDSPVYARGYMGVRESGNLDVFWHRWEKEKQGYKSVLVHHGGKNGFDNINIPLRQCIRIITGYIGIEEVIPASDENLSEKDIKPPVTLKEFVETIDQTAGTVLIPGHQQWAQGIKWEFDRAIRAITVTRDAIRLGESSSALSNLRAKLDRSTNPFLHEAGDALEEALLSSDRFSALEGLRRGNINILSRIEQIDRMVLSVMQRYNRLEAHRSSNEINIRQMYFEVVRSLGKWQDSPELKVQTAQNLAKFSKSYLDNFITNPYKLRSRRFSNLSGLDTIFGTEGQDRVERVILNAGQELNLWKNEIDEAIKGRFEHRYPLKAS